MVRAHRFAYELWVAPIPPEREIDHLCRVRGCVNPTHMEPVTTRENVNRGLVHGQRWACGNAHAAGNVWNRGERSPNAKLSADDVLSIRDNPLRLTQKALGAEFGVDRRTIGKIQRGESWAHLTTTYDLKPSDNEA